MFRLVYSNRAEALLAELAASVRELQAGEGALVPVRVVVPNANVEAFVRLGVARENGIAANLEAAQLRRFAAEIVERANPGSHVADAEAMQAMALTLLLDDALLADDATAPVRAYLRAAGDAPDAIDVRRTQLAGRIGRLFEEYAYSRAEMLGAWEKGETLEGRALETERWQRLLWTKMFGPGGLATARRLVPPHAIADSLAATAAALPRRVHVFGFSYFARTFHRLLDRLARVTEVCVYALSPCEGFWEDYDRRDPAPLRLWGRPGREHVRALDALAEFDHDDRFVDPLERGSPTVLRRLQSDLRRREPARNAAGDAAAAMPPDESIVILECPGVRREMEIVASEIWRLLEQDDTLRFDDIAVLVAGDPRETLAHLRAAFAEAHDLPHQIVDVPLAGESRVLEAVEMLLALPLGRFTRHELLRLAVHPCVGGSRAEVDTARWLAWCDALGVVHGADRDDHAGTYIGRDILNWDQGLRRLALGAFMEGDASGARAPFELGGEAYVPHDVAASELHDAASFGALVRSLVADACFARDAKLGMTDWAAWLEGLVETYVTPADEGEEEHLARCLRRLHGLAAVDLTGAEVSYRVASELARERIAAMPGARGGEGVVVSTFAPMRATPFRVVFACGMGEGRFPAAEGDDPLDLRASRRREGDVTPRERDKYTFLELLLGTRDRLYVAFVARDPLTGDALAPSSVVQELLHTLESGYVRDRASLRRVHPLRRWDERYFPELFGGAPASAPALGTMRLPEAHAEARTLALRLGAEGAGALPTRDEVQTRASGGASWLALAEHLRLPLVPAAAPPRPADARVVVSLYAITKFLELPLQGWARFRVGLDEADDEDVLAREDEPFETAPREETLLLRDVVYDAAARGCSLEQAYDDTVRGREVRGRGPSGVFAAGERDEHLSTLSAWKDELARFDVPLSAVELHRFGRAGEHQRADHVHEALVLDVGVVDEAGATRIVRVEIDGRTLPLAPGASASLTLAKRRTDEDNDWARAERERMGLRAFVDHVVLAASGLAPDRRRRSLVVIATPQDPVTEEVAFEAMTRDEAGGWLRGVIAELLGRPHAYFLPCEAVFVHKRAEDGGPITPYIEEARDRLAGQDGAGSLRSAYGPVPRPHEYPAPDEASARAMVDRRFGAYFRVRRLESR
jgi:exodeoxyribonuclease V gamma subunit